jgi:hypothetical protein
MYELEISIIIILVIVALYLYHNKEVTAVKNESFEGSWVNGAFIIVKDDTCHDNYTICCDNLKLTIPCRAENCCDDNNTTKLLLPEMAPLPWKKNECKMIYYNNKDDVLVYDGHLSFDEVKNNNNLFNKVQMEVMPTKTLTILGRNDIRVVYHWDDSITINNKITNNFNNRDVYYSSIPITPKPLYPGNRDVVNPYDMVANTQHLYSYVDTDKYDNLLKYDDSTIINKVKGQWMGGSININPISQYSFEMCNNSNTICNYGKLEGNKLQFDPPIEMHRRINDKISNCQSLYYVVDDNKDEMLVWKGGDCAQQYVDVGVKDLNLYIGIYRNKMIFYLNNIDALTNATVKKNMMPSVFNPMYVLIRPYF